ncbi:MAG: hypothetical protein BAJALOKI2v1_770010 [Promethearchaeota archaeon]|nr:MAG: hypothetical protein BAJALOKI2v1_770010 [Candidatus Lokiarchaeota archaeon]
MKQRKINSKIFLFLFFITGVKTFRKQSDFILIGEKLIIKEFSIIIEKF